MFGGKRSFSVLLVCSGYGVGWCVGVVMAFMVSGIFLGVNEACEPYFPRLVQARDYLWAWNMARKHEDEFSFLSQQADAVTEQVAHEVLETAKGFTLEGAKFAGGPVAADGIAALGSYARRVLEGKTTRPTE